MNVNGLPEPFRTCGGGSRPQSVRSTTAESCGTAAVTRNRNSGAGTPQFQSLAGGGSAYIRNNQVLYITYYKNFSIFFVRLFKGTFPRQFCFRLSLCRPEETNSYRKQPAENSSPVLLTLARNQNIYEYLKSFKKWQKYSTRD
jgi:hypothetical protein